MIADDLMPFTERDPSPKMRLHLAGGLTFDVDDLDDLIVNLESVEFSLPSDGKNFREAVINLSHVLWVEVITPM